MAVPFQDGLSQFFDDSGNPLAGGFVDTYAAGTTTRQATYTNRSGGIEHENPVALDSAGRASIWLDRSLSYRFDLKDADGALIDSVDNIIISDGSSPAYRVETFTATEGQTVITMVGEYTPGINSIAVYVGDGGGLYMVKGDDYTETSASSITFTSPLAEGETVTVIYGNPVSVGGVSDAADVAYTPPSGLSTNVADRLDRVLYVADYGTTTSAFQAAIDALPAAGGTIDGSSGTYTGIGTLEAGSKRIHWQNFRSVNGLETSAVLPGNQTRVGPAIANGRGFMVSPDLIISQFSDANAILPALFLTKDSTVGVDGSGLAKIQWRGTSAEGQKNVDGGRMDSVIIDATRATFTARMNISPHVDGNDESQPTISFQDGVTVPAIDALVDITITNGGTGYTVGDDITITSADGTGADALVTKATGGVVSRVSIQANGYDFVDGETLTLTGGTGTGLAATAIVPSNMFMYGHGTVNTARKYLLNNTVVGEYDYVNDRTQANFDVIEVQDDADPAAFSDALGNGIVNVGAAYYVRNVPTWQYNSSSGKIRQNRDFGHRTVAIAAADSPYTMDGLPEVLLISATAGNVSVTLPAANFFGTGYASRVLIRRTDSSSNTVTINRAGSDTINGRTSVTLTAGAGDTFVSNGSTAWVMESAAGQAVNIRDYGAVGDGSTDDRAAFAAANTAGQAIYIPKPATGYTFSSALALTVPVEVDPGATWDQITDGGNLTWGAGSTSGNGADIYRLGGRLFVGNAADKFAGNTLATPDAGTSSFTGLESVSYLAINAQALSIAGDNQYALVGLARGTDLSGTGIIGVSGAIWNDKASGRGWAGYFDVQHETGADVSNGFEVAVKNKSTDNLTYKPYQRTFGTIGGRFTAGGDVAYGGVATNPSNAAIIIINDGAGGQTWNRGIVFTADALTGTDGSVGSTTSAVAINLARKHVIQWDAPDNAAGAQIVSNVTDSSAFTILQFNDNFVNMLGANGKQFFRAAHAASGVNYLQVGSAAAGSSPFISALGDDTNLDINIVPKGSGVVKFGTWTSNADAAVNGYVTIKDAGGTTRKLATIA